MNWSFRGKMSRLSWTPGKLPLLFPARPFGETAVMLIVGSSRWWFASTAFPLLAVCSFAE